MSFILFGYLLALNRILWLNIILLGYLAIFWLSSLLIFGSMDRTYAAYQYIITLSLGNLHFPYPFIALALDGLSLSFIMLTGLILFLCLLTSFDNTVYFIKEYSNLMFLIFILLILSFTVTDVLSFFFLFESILLPMFLLIGIWGTVYRKIYASLLFICFTLVGSIFFFLSLLLLYVEAGTFSYSLLSKLNVSYTKLLILGFLVFLTFAVKMPMYPFHIWLPEAHVEAPSVGSVILAGILLKLGGYGFVRILYPCFKIAIYYYFPFISTLAFLGIIFPSLIILCQLDLKRIIAYASISHMNIVVLGIFSDNIEGLLGSCFLMLAHGLVSALFFFLIGFIYTKYKSRNFLYYSGLCHTMPLFSFIFFLACMGNIGLPLTCNFIGEILIFIGLFDKNKFILLGCLLSIIITAIYTIYVFNRLCFGNLSKYIKSFRDLTELEFEIIIPLVLYTFLLGIRPNLSADLLMSNLSFILEKTR